MKIFDMHIHALNTETNPKELIEKMDKAGVYGGCIFSNMPIEDGSQKEDGTNAGTTFEERLNEVLSWCEGYEDRLFPVLWIHPYEENILENVHTAISKGICAFKMICSNYYVYEEKCLEVLQEIATLNKPVIFHSGILWDGQDSSKYNRPVNWEALLDVKGLRFSLAHCSWPWVDECVALYGKFLHTARTKETAEMYIDIAPGTPPLYRMDALRKLYHTFNVSENILFGADCTADDYDAAYVRDILNRDNKIYKELGVSKENLEKLYATNLLRFLGKTEHMTDANISGHYKPLRATYENPETYKIIDKYYKELGFPKEYDAAFYRALEEIKISDAIDIESYDFSEKDGTRNLLSYLYMCKALDEKYKEKSIPREVFLDTVKDFVTWTNTWTDIKGELCIGQIKWLSSHLKMNLFRLGRLQFRMGNCEYDIPEENLKKGDSVLEVHIPYGEALTPESCEQSFNLAEKFFAEFYPEFKYSHFTCHSWLMDDTLSELLSENSNIIKFSGMFNHYNPEKDDAILRYTFKWNTSRLNLKNAVISSSFTRKIKDHIASGKDFYIAFGVRKIGERL